MRPLRKKACGPKHVFEVDGHKERTTRRVNGGIWEVPVASQATSVKDTSSASTRPRKSVPEAVHVPSSLPA